LRIKAYDRFKGNISEKASLGASLAEASASIAMVQDRALQLWRFGRALRRGKILEAANELKSPVPPSLRRYGDGKLVPRHLRTASGQYLEFHFGWSPLVGDIYNAIDFLQNPLKSVEVKGSEQGRRERRNGNPAAPFSVIEDFVDDYKVRYGAQIAISNPNLYLANGLGLVNPATVAWEVVPFSFVVDWIVNVEQFLSSATDLLGLDVKMAFTSTRVNISYKKWLNWNGNPTVNTGKVDRIQRETGIVTPNLALRPFKVFGWRRALAASSLLVQQLKSYK
jgi:hypothetical protein